MGTTVYRNPISHLGWGKSMTRLDGKAAKLASARVKSHRRKLGELNRHGDESERA